MSAMPVPLCIGHRISVGRRDNVDFQGQRRVQKVEDHLQRTHVDLSRRYRLLRLGRSTNTNHNRYASHERRTRVVCPQRRTEIDGNKVDVQEMNDKTLTSPCYYNLQGQRIGQRATKGWLIERHGRKLLLHP